MLKYFFIFFFVLLLTQIKNIHEAKYHCHYQRSKDLELLSKDICCDIQSRLRFKKEVDCEGSERRVRENLILCIFNQWVENSDAYTKIYLKLIESYFAIIGFIVPILCIMLYFWTQERNHRYTVDKLTGSKKELLRLQ